MRRGGTWIPSLVALALAAAGCRDRPDERERVPTGDPSSPGRGAADRPIALGDSPAAVRVDFNAHRGQARFLTLLAPT